MNNLQQVENNSQCSEMVWGDLFAGGGGTTTGALCVDNVSVAWALNHSREAIYTHEVNHPETEHFHADIRNMDEKKLSPVDGLWASLECTNFSNAKGGLPRDEDSRTLAYELDRYIIWCDPDVITIENVREFLSWGPLNEEGKPISKDKGKDYLEWVNHLKSMGYVNYEYKILDSANYGAYTTRKRYFGVFTKSGFDIKFPTATHKKEEWLPCKEKINLNSTGNSIFGRKKPLVERTLQRIAAGIKKFHPEVAHVMSYYGNGYNGQSIQKPLNTITTKDRHLLVNVKGQFIQEYYGRDNAQTSLDQPLKTITTANRHSLVTMEKEHFVSDHIWGASNQSVDKPLNTICTKESKQLISMEGEGDPHHLEEKYQFITKYFSGNGNPQGQNSSVEEPLGTIMTVNKHALLTVLMNGEFDIKIRFLTPQELGDITGFPENYQWYGSKQFQIWMIGNAVPIKMAQAVIQSVKQTFDENKSN